MVFRPLYRLYYKVGHCWWWWYEDYINIMKNVLPVVVTGIPAYIPVGRGGGGSSLVGNIF